MRGAFCIFVVFVGGAVGGCAPRHVAVLGGAQSELNARLIGPGRDGTRLVIEPGDGVKPLVRAIDRSTRTVFIEAYILTDRSIVRALDRASAHGVAVYVLLDHRPFGMGNQPDQIASSLLAAGIAVRWTAARFRYTHAKFLVLDDRLAVVATANFSQSAFRRNRELLVFDRNRTDVHELSNLFRADWDHIPPRFHDSNVILSPGSRGAIRSYLRRARASVDVYAEEVADPGLGTVLERLSQHVRVRILVASGYKSTVLKHLRLSRVQVRGLRNPYVHAKMFLLDGRSAFIGSENMSPVSLDSNREVGIIVRGSAARRASATFEQDWSRATNSPP